MNKARTAKNHQDDGATVLSALFPTAIMCRNCQYGPVDYKNCDDLYAHHGRRYNGGLGRISNACPRCNWYSGSRQDWMPWDGVVRMGPFQPALHAAAAMERGMVRMGPVRPDPHKAGTPGMTVVHGNLSLSKTRLSLLLHFFSFFFSLNSFLLGGWR